MANAACLVTGDLNGDGIPDLLVPSNGTVVAYLGNGDGTFTLKGNTATPSGGYLALGDFNHDGKLDFATSGNLLALGNGDGSFQTPTAIVSNPPGTGFSNIAAGDINNDGWPDLVLTNPGQELSKSKSWSGYTPAWRNSPIGTRTVLRMRDLDCLSIAETTEALAISKTAVKSTHFRARKRLAYALTPLAKGKETNVY